MAHAPRDGMPRGTVWTSEDMEVDGVSMRRTTLVLLLTAGCASGRQAPDSPAPESASEPPAPAAASPPGSTPPPDPLAGKTADESWAWALSFVPELSKVTPRPDTADFSELTMHGGRLTLFAPKLTLGMATKQPRPCLPLPVILEDGSLVTRVSLDGRAASPDLRDEYAILRLGVEFDDHDARSAGFDMAYASPGSDPLLSGVERGVIRYDGTPVGYAVLCGTHEETRACSDGTTQVCRSCTPFVTQVPDPGHRASGSMGRRQTCDPCPPDPVAQDLAALNRVVSNRSFIEVSPGSGPSFYTSRAACKKALTAKPSSSRGSPR